MKRTVDDKELSSNDYEFITKKGDITRLNPGYVMVGNVRNAGSCDRLFSGRICTLGNDVEKMVCGDVIYFSYKLMVDMDYALVKADDVLMRKIR